MSELQLNADITNAFPRKKIMVEDILLWHDNPRNVSKIQRERPLNVLSKLDSTVYNQMLQDAEIGQLVRTILKAGWRDDGDLMVGYYKKDKKFFVLEGNRRITALRVIIEDYNAGNEKCSRFPSSTNIQDFYKKYLADGISVKVAHSKDSNEPPVDYPGDADTWKPETKAAIQQWIAGIHQNPKLGWGLDQRITNSFQVYMNKLHEVDHSVDVTSVSSFYINSDVLADVADIQELSQRALREQLYTTTLVNQVTSKIADMGGTVPDKIASIFTEGLLQQKSLRERYGFGDPDNREGRMYDGEYLEKFVSLYFDIGNQKKVITAMASGESSSRDYNYVIQHDKSPDEYFISMIEEEKKPTSFVKALLKAETESTEVIKTLKLINSKLKHPSIQDLTEVDMEDDKLVEVMNDCVEGFDRLRRLLEKV